MNKPLKGEIWLTRLDPTEGREQAKTRPCVILSNDKFNKSAVELVFAAPLTSKNKNIPIHILIKKETAGLAVDSFIMPEQIRSLSISRCSKLLGRVDNKIFIELQQKIKVIFDID